MDLGIGVNWKCPATDKTVGQHFYNHVDEQTRHKATDIVTNIPFIFKRQGFYDGKNYNLEERNQGEKTLRKPQRKEANKWNFFQFEQFLTYKAEGHVVELCL